MKKSIKKALCLLLTISATAGFMSGCSTETKTPEIQMKLEYGGKKYTLNYTLSRSAAPNTVRHFLKLVENDYYDGLCIHDYQVGSKMYTGGYTYEEEKLVDKSYYSVVKNYKDFNHTVWKDSEKKEPLYTLYGEFSANKFYAGDSSGKNALKESFGALTMYYTEKDVEDEVSVLMTSDKVVSKEYKYNSATSLFSIALKDFATVNSNYCTFATLKENSVENLEDLVEEIGEDDITTQTTVEIDRDDAFVKDYEKTAEYNLLNTPLIIEQIKITKY